MVSPDTASRSASAKQGVMTVPNQLTVARLVLSVALFVAMSFEYFGTSLVLFIVAASTDWLDGYLARRYGWVSTLGRILDPFADKIIICGTFIFLLDVPSRELHALGLRAWIVALIVGRELLITALRSFLEQQGRDFSASMSGKLKMVAQCIAAGLCLGLLGWGTLFGAWIVMPSWYGALLTASLWVAAFLTAYSGVAYIVAAVRMIRDE
ncbi:MAG: CDP-diacylglycerol--glycerol-3-phosphate 3-phosphatidyltransferase [Planctomycetes bacterium]|nr:CDP-diacylglycerol--glycerol-3-phosphate 3-phosphatidyltransferase [Planctomycetota bacterium]